MHRCSLFFLKFTNVNQFNCEPLAKCNQAKSVGCKLVLTFPVLFSLFCINKNCVLMSL